MSADGRRGRNPVRMLARALGALGVVGFIALLVYGLVAQSPDSTIDDALARARSTSAPGFELDVLQRGRQPTDLESTVDRAGADGRVSLTELRGNR